MENTQTRMYLIYIDESYDTTHYAYSALFIDALKWNAHFHGLIKWRSELFEQYQIPVDYELHATDFVGGRGKHPKNRNKTYRASLFYEAIGRIGKMEDLQVMNAITKDKRKYLGLFERMLNRINRTLEAKNAIGILICDQGNENKLTSIVRKMKKENHIPSTRYHQRKTGHKSRNIPLDRIIEDPLFKTSKSSYFIQLCDFLAFSLLRNEKPLAQSTLQPVQAAFNQLDAILIKVASNDDPKGIIRV